MSDIPRHALIEIPFGTKHLEIPFGTRLFIDSPDDTHVYNSLKISSKKSVYKLDYSTTNSAYGWFKKST